MRQELTIELNEVIEEFAPKIWEDFDSSRIIRPTSSVPASPETQHRRKSSYEQNDLLNHPLAWLDERLFGWSQYEQKRPRQRNGTNGSDTDGASNPSSEFNSDTEEGDGDFDSVIGTLGSVMGMEKRESRSRRSSRSLRSKSRTNLTDLNSGPSETAKSTAVDVGGR